MTTLTLLAAAQASGFMAWLNSIPAGIWVVVSTIFGGIGLKVVEKYLNKNVGKNDERRDIHQELQTALGRIDALEEEVTKFRLLYYDQMEQVAVLRQYIIKSGGELPPQVRGVRNTD